MGSRVPPTLAILFIGNTSLLLGWPIFRGELLVSGSVYIPSRPGHIWKDHDVFSCLQETTILEKLVSKALEFFAPAEKVPKKLAETETLSFIKKVEPGPPG